MNATLLRDLLDKYMSETASPQERAQLHTLLQNDDYSRVLAGIIDDDLGRQHYDNAPDENIRQQLLDRIMPVIQHGVSYSEILPAAAHSIMPQETGLAAISRKEQVAATTLSHKALSAPVVTMRRRLQRMAYAAAILLLFVSTAVWLKWPLHKPQEQPAIAIAAIPPGRNGAILTLADGSTILLDSAANGAVASDANGTITKTADGSLVYIAGNGFAGTGAQLFNTLRTPPGRQFNVVLPDGSKVWLNAASTLRYPTAFAGNERLVSLTGEAYFEVTSNSSRPFKVQSPGQLVQVLGTHFNINAYANEPLTNTTLLEGSVSVTALPFDSIAGQTLKLQPKLLLPGQQSQRNTAGGLAIVHADVQQSIAWKEGLFSFKKADLRAIMRQVERWYQVQVAYERNPGGETFTGKIGRNLSLQELMEGLAFTHVKYRIEPGNKIVIE
ncbi:FecR domain-containing protein [Filimonas effusa]|uniref:FecR family protein n=1 Tax=Filimonas effusa TaxID=2508721 RepID=A0A4Q1D5G8_9BACT|nr:FecR domain-containing protein [Filimonas effusa]RXK83216.1 FecR family protein [Filimonas effusa]